jgi:hypothetical protein
MSREVKLNTGVLNVFCGHFLSPKVQDELIRITLKEFEKPIKRRRQPYLLVQEAKNIIKYEKWVKESK